MRVVIFGSRDYHYMYMLEELIEESGYDITEVVCGMATGVDTLGRLWATYHDIPVKEFPALWHQHGKRAGPIRNELMGEYAEAGLGLYYPYSKGSLGMTAILERLGKPCHVKVLSDTRECWD